MQRNKYVHKKNWDLHREGGPWSIKKVEEETGSVLSSNQIDHGKKMCKFVEMFWKDLESVLKDEIYPQEVWKRFEFRKFERNIFESALKST